MCVRCEKCPVGFVWHYDLVFLLCPGSDCFKFWVKGGDEGGMEGPDEVIAKLSA